MSERNSRRVVEPPRWGVYAMALGAFGVLLSAPLLVLSVEVGAGISPRLASLHLLAEVVGGFLGLLGGYVLHRVNKGSALVAIGGALPLLFLLPLAEGFLSRRLWFDTLILLLGDLWAIALLVTGLLSARKPHPPQSAKGS